MAYIIPVETEWVEHSHPQIPDFLAPNATLIGDVRVGKRCSVWFNVVIRADINYISLGDDTNVQDNSVLHVSKKLPCILGNKVSVGHNVTVHACTVGDGCLVGMGSRVLDGVTVGENSLIAAGCVVPEGLTVPPGHLVAGVPGRILKPLSGELQQRIAGINGDYLAYQSLYPEILSAAQHEH